jgi:undecaprenyl-diphosphatase
MPPSPSSDSAPGLRRPPLIAMAVVACAAAIGLLAAIGFAIDHGRQFHFDSAIMLAMRQPGAPDRPAGPWWLPLAMRDLTALGGETVLTLAMTLVTGFLLVSRRHLTAGLLVAGAMSGSIAVAIIKTAVGRPRPTLIDHLTQVASYSFPSGHSANSAVIYLTLALTVSQVIPGVAARRYVIGAAALIVILIGISRVYLGVHWPSDVLAGWCFGALWALMWWAIGARIRLGRAAAA